MPAITQEQKRVQELKARIEYLKQVILDLEEERVEHCINKNYEHTDKITEKIIELEDERYEVESQLLAITEKEGDEKKELENSRKAQEQKEKERIYKEEFNDIIQKLNESDNVIKDLKNKVLPVNLFTCTLREKVSICHRFANAHLEYKTFIVRELRAYLDKLLEREKALINEDKRGMAFVVKEKYEFMRKEAGNYYKSLNY